MAREFGTYSPRVPLGVTWEELLELVDVNGDPIDLTGYGLRAQFYEEQPERDDATGIATVAPIAEITSAGIYVTPPAWPVFATATLPTPTEGKMLWAVPVVDLWTFSPDNTRRIYFWALKLVKPDGYAIPIVQGKASFSPVNTI